MTINVFLLSASTFEYLFLTGIEYYIPKEVWAIFITRSSYMDRNSNTVALSMILLNTVRLYGFLEINVISFIRNNSIAHISDFRTLIILEQVSKSINVMILIKIKLVNNLKFVTLKSDYQFQFNHQTPSAFIFLMLHTAATTSKRKYLHIKFVSIIRLA